MKIKLVKIILIVFILQFILCFNTVEAAFWDDIFSSGKNFLQTGKTEAEKGDAANTTDVKNIMNDLYSILFPLGVVTTVIVGGVLGIKFMMASAEDKAKVKESMIPYVVGSVAIYGAFGIWKIVIEILSAIA